MTICELLTLLLLEYIGDFAHGVFLLRVIARRNCLQIRQIARSLLFQFARMFYAVLDLPATSWADTVAAQIRAASLASFLPGHVVLPTLILPLVQEPTQLIPTMRL